MTYNNYISAAVYRMNNRVSDGISKYYSLKLHIFALVIILFKEKNNKSRAACRLVVHLIDGLNQTFYFPLAIGDHDHRPPFQLTTRRRGVLAPPHLPKEQAAPPRGVDQPRSCQLHARRLALRVVGTIVGAEEAEEVGVRANDVAERAALVDGDVDEEELLQRGHVADAAARVQPHCARHLHHGLEEVGAGRAGGHRQRMDVLVPQPACCCRPRRMLRLAAGGGEGVGGRATQRAGVVASGGRLAAVRRARRRGALGRVDDGVGTAGQREEEAAGGDGVGEVRRVGLGLGFARVDDAGVDEGGRWRRRRQRRRPGGRPRRGRRFRQLLRRRRYQLRPPDGWKARPHHALRGPRHPSL
jgi:hypothetical protein